jgi:hypothetical protein
MNMAPRNIAVLLARVVALVIVMMLLIVLGGQVMNTPAPTVQQGAQTSPQAFKPLTAGDQQLAAKVLPLVALLNTLVLAYIVQRSRWRGWKLVAAVFVFFYGAAWFMGQIESAVFLTVFSNQMIARLMLMGLIISAPFSFVAVAIFGKLKGAAAEPAATMPHGKSLAVRMAAIGLLYVGVYFFFGYYVAWKNPAVHAYYSGTDPGSFVLQLRSVAQGSWWLFPLQFVRGVLWALIALPIIRMTKGPWWHSGLAVALGLCVLTSSQLLFPNSFMPEAVRMAHLVEVSTSNFLFGWIVARLLISTAPVAKLTALVHQA